MRARKLPEARATGRAGRAGRACALALLVLGLPCAPVAAQELPAAAGRTDLVLAYESSRGRYREATPTYIRQTSVTARYWGEGWGAELQLPWVAVDAGGDAGGLPEGAQAGRAREQGLGDIWLKAGVTLREADAASPGVDLVAKLKTRSGDAARGLGSGGTDLALQVEWLQALAPATLFGHLGWRRTGDVPGFRPYRNPWYAQLGALHALSPALELGAYADLREPIGRLGAQGEGTLYAAWRHERQRWQVYVTRGWRDASVDLALGLSWRIRH